MSDEKPEHERIILRGYAWPDKPLQWDPCPICEVKITGIEPIYDDGDEWTADDDGVLRVHGPSTLIGVRLSPCDDVIDGFEWMRYDSIPLNPGDPGPPMDLLGHQPESP